MGNRAALTRNPQWIEEAKQTVHAIRQGAVDAFVVEEADGHRVFTLEGADLPYSVLVQNMSQPAAMLNAAGEIVYSNPSLARLLSVPHESMVGRVLKDFVEAADQNLFDSLRDRVQSGPWEGELRLRRSDGTTIPVALSCTLLSRDKSATGVLITDLTMHHQQTELARRLQHSQDEERRRIARELHDSVGQLLVAVTLNLAAIAEESDKLSPKATRCLQENAELVQDITDQIRTISHLLHPPLLDEVGLTSALRWLIEGFSKRGNIQTTLEIPNAIPRLLPDVEIAIFRTVQESLSNVHRHSGSSRCAVTLLRAEGQIQVQVRDWGRGIPLDQLPTLTDSGGGVGLRGLQERLRYVGGTLEITSLPDGTLVSATVPA